MKKSNLAAAFILCGFLLAMVLGYVLLPDRDFSEMEKRYLAEAPKFSLSAFFSGNWTDDAEDYLTDHVPGRNLFVGVHAYLELLLGRQGLKDVWVLDGKLVEAPVAPDAAAIEKNMAAINAFADTAGRPVDLMLIPSAGWAAGSEDYQDSQALAAIEALAGENIAFRSVEDSFAGRPELYYNTDHHWTSQGAWEGYRAYMTAIGREYRDASDFTVTVVEDFQGSTYSRSALWLTPAETLELWQGSDGITVTNQEAPDTVHEGVFYHERLLEADKYTAFLDGNHSLVRVTNPGAEGKLLVIRDSYSNSLGCFLAESYGEVVLLDLRYYKQPISQLLAQEEFDNILICYSVSNFLTDTNIVWLR